MSLFVKKFGKFMRKSYNPSFSYNNANKYEKLSTDMNCCNCGRPGHFAADCNRAKKEDRPRRDEKKDDRSKERSKARRMRTRSDKNPNRKNDRKVLVAEESTKSWVDSDSDSSSSSSSSSDSEQEEVHCLMANQSSDDEVFDFTNTEFTRKDLITALNEIVHEYKKLSHTFEEVKAENMDLKNSSAEPSTVQLGETDSLQIELSKLKTENESLRLRSYFNAGESSSGETCTQSNLAYDKFKKMNFVKASVIHDTCESVRYDDQISGKLNQKGKAGIGYVRPENSKYGWPKNRLDKEKAKAGSKSFDQNQQRRGSKKLRLVLCEELLRLDKQSRAMVNAGQRSCACDWLCWYVATGTRRGKHCALFCLATGYPAAGSMRRRLDKLLPESSGFLAGLVVAQYKVFRNEEEYQQKEAYCAKKRSSCICPAVGSILRFSSWFGVHGMGSWISNGDVQS
ncbi:hypothetical protein F511_36070 [Dorcoceras hygrometricum]|uniref:CCHC-type domain-containing protein n=1 Tax=Dorcoceras hygrometricum TaxID=472368 RepID=A0A2Z7DJS1_9LAMI|nr:hypothetical protein F511_36070 [Dorcoceras hygrometricum]